MDYTWLKFFYIQHVKQEQKRKNIFGGNIP